MRAAALIRTGSILVQHQTGSVLRRTYSTTTVATYQRSTLQQAKKYSAAAAEAAVIIRRARSDTDLIGPNRCVRVAVPDRVAEEEEVEAEVEYSGGGMGRSGKKVSGGRGGDRQPNSGGESRRVGEYYQEMILADPENQLLLRNYASFLHEVEGDVEAAEEYYGRAILASPSDGEVLSMYGKLVWESHRDEHRAETYFERAVEACPDNCYVLGSYAHFLWEAEDEDEEKVAPASSSHLVEDF